MEKKYDIFISYSRKDSAVVEQYSEYLNATGLSVWIDKKGIETGDEFKRNIVRAIKNSDVFLFFSSVNSNASPWTVKEVNVAVNCKKRIIPVKLDSTPYEESIMFDLAGLDFFDYANNGFETGIEKLLSVFGKDYGLVVEYIKKETERQRLEEEQKRQEESLRQQAAIEAQKRIEEEKLALIREEVYKKALVAEERARIEAEEKVRKEAEEKAKEEARVRAEAKRKERQRRREATEARKRAEKESWEEHNRIMQKIARDDRRKENREKIIRMTLNAICYPLLVLYNYVKRIPYALHQLIEIVGSCMKSIVNRFDSTSDFLTFIRYIVLYVTLVIWYWGTDNESSVWECLLVPIFFMSISVGLVDGVILNLDTIKHDMFNRGAYELFMCIFIGYFTYFIISNWIIS